MAEMLLDVTVFNDLREGDIEARRLIETILDGTAKAAVSSLTVCELWHRGEIDRRTEIGFLSVLRFVEEITPDFEISRTAGLWLANCDEFNGRDATYVTLTAATAKKHGIPICTRDVEAFEQFGIEITAY